MTTNNSPGETTRSLTAAVETFCAWVTAQPEAPPCEPGWGLRETLAHLVYHHEIYVCQAQALVTGEPAALPQGTFKEINAAAVAELSGIPLAELIARLQTANQRLCALYDEFNLADGVIHTKTGSTPWKLKDLLPCVAGHLRSHLAQLKKAARNKTGRAKL